jgi:hypothetical protein
VVLAILPAISVLILFYPSGKVVDFFGFQYLRNTTQAGKGYSTDFVTHAANNVYTSSAKLKRQK